MNYEQVKNLQSTEFKRYYGVAPETFKKMIKVVTAEKTLQKKKTGRPSKLQVEDQILMTMEYLGEYHACFEIGINWGVDESTAYRIIVKIESILIRSELFNVPGRSAVKDRNSAREIVVDVAEQSVDRLKYKGLYI